VIFLLPYITILWIYWIPLGCILIDRCGKHFGTILNYLRDNTFPLPENTKEMAELLAEAKYYCISELAEYCEQAIRTMDTDSICRVPLITSEKEEILLIGSTTKPIVKLLVNRHNNKYSYTRYNSFSISICMPS
jgi:BTB/POZ domain-containing adapter for CUL3-mediated RhoA degradation protein